MTTRRVLRAAGLVRPLVVAIPVVAVALVALPSDTIALDTNEIALDTNEIGLDTNEIALDTNKIGLDTNEIGLDANAIGLHADTVVLHGTIRAEGLRSDSVLPGAFIQVRRGAKLRTAVSDDRGRYRIEGLGPGTAQVAAFHLATHPLEVEVRLPEAGDLALDLELERRAIAMADLKVEVPSRSRLSGPGRVQPASVPRRTPGVVGEATARGLNASTGMVESGLARALTAPADDPDPDPSRVLFMRGSTVDARTVFLDGAPVMTPFHVAGLVSPFEPELVGGAHLYLGAAPSRYGGGLSYLLDVETRQPGLTGVHGSAAVDGLLWRGSFETPLPGGGGVLFAGRALHGTQGAMGSSGKFPYTYRDFLFRSGVPLARGHHMDFMAFRNEEGVRLDEVLLEEGDARWGNRAGSMRYRGRTGPLSIAAGVAWSRYDSSLPLAWSEPVVARASSARDRATLDVLVPADGWRLHLGGSADRVDYTYLLQSRRESSITAVAREQAEMGVTTVGGYAEISTTVGDHLYVRGGLRGDVFSGGRGAKIGPRATARLFLTDDALLTASAGRYHQPVPLPGLRASVREDRIALDWGPRLPVASSTHLVLSLDQTLDDRIHLGISGFVKAFDGIPGQLDAVHASGTDLRVEHAGERVSLWTGYALSWYWEGASGTRSSTFSGRHLVSAGARGRFYEGLDVGLSLGYGAGLPYTPVQLTNVEDAVTGIRQPAPVQPGFYQTSSSGAEPLDIVPADDFLRVDVELAWSASPSVAGRSTRLRPYVRVLNALDNRDALFHYLDEWREGETRPVAQRPFLPVVGVEWRF